MSIRLSPPPCPGGGKRSHQGPFAQLEFSPEKVYDVHIEELSVGGAMVEFLGPPPPSKMAGAKISVFIDVGYSDGERISGTIAAELLYFCPSSKRGPAQALLMWFGCDPRASLVIHRLLRQQERGVWQEELCTKAA